MSEPEHESDERIVEVYWAPDAQEAHVVAGLLDDAGIEARVVGEMLQAAAGELPWGPTISPRVWVSESDRARALAVIDEWQEKRRAGHDAPRPAWHCPRCGARVDGSFQVCWKCQVPGPAAQGAGASTDATAAAPPDAATAPGRSAATSAAPAQESTPWVWWWPSTLGGSAVLLTFVLAGWVVGSLMGGGVFGLLYAAWWYFLGVLVRGAYLKVSGKR